jgi:hypothetical protein
MVCSGLVWGAATGWRHVRFGVAVNLARITVQHAK